jgi:YD repeat-containing protein
MNKVALILLGSVLVPGCLMACGLEWTLPQGHFDGVEEHGYVEYWEKIGEADLGDGLVIPVNIGFNSHQEASSPTLGKGWMIPLLESHVEPIDENSMKVIMPDGWTFTFLRNGSTETWRGNANWVGETNNTVFTITAPCGWRVKFDEGKIQEIESDKNRTLSYRYNGGIVTEVDVDGKPFIQVESNTSTGVPTNFLIGGKKINISLAQRPRIQALLKQNLLTGFDQSLSSLLGPDGRKEAFAFGTTDKTLDPALTITHADQSKRYFTWDATTRQIKIDGEWSYDIAPGDNIALKRTNSKGQAEFFDQENGTTTIQDIDGVKLITSRFVNAGNLSGKIRLITRESHNVSSIVSRYDYNENGKLLRETNEEGLVTKYTYDKSQRCVLISYPDGHSVTYSYDAKGFPKVSVVISEMAKHSLMKEQKRLETTMSTAIGITAKNYAALKLGLFYINAMQTPEEGRKLAAGGLMIPKVKFTLLLQSYDHDASLTPAQKLTYFKELLQQFPKESKLLNQLLEMEERQQND